jgi:hypothetical protein
MRFGRPDSPRQGMLANHHPADSQSIPRRKANLGAAAAATRSAGRTPTAAATATLPAAASALPGLFRTAAASAAITTLPLFPVVFIRHGLFSFVYVRTWN